MNGESRYPPPYRHLSVDLSIYRFTCSDRQVYVNLAATADRFLRGRSRYEWLIRHLYLSRTATKRKYEKKRGSKLARDDVV